MQRPWSRGAGNGPFGAYRLIDIQQQLTRYDETEQQSSRSTLLRSDGFHGVGHGGPPRLGADREQSNKKDTESDRNEEHRRD